MARRRQRGQLKPSGLPDAVVLDASAVSGAAAGDVRVHAELALAEQLGVEVHLSSVPVAETLRGHPLDARVQALLAGTDQDSVTPQLGRMAGELLGHTNRDHTIDAIVPMPAEALGRVRVLTGDPDDLNALTTDMPNVIVISI